MMIAEDADQIIGMCMGRFDTCGGGTKLRCIRVLEDYQKRGVGIHLIDKMLKLIEDDKPLCTVPEPMLHDLSRIMVNYFDFDLTEVIKGLYKPGVLEYVFNGEQHK